MVFGPKSLYFSKAYYIKLREQWYIANVNNTDDVQEKIFLNCFLHDIVFRCA